MVLGNSNAVNFIGQQEHFIVGNISSIYSSVSINDVMLLATRYYQTIVAGYIPLLHC